MTLVHIGKNVSINPDYVISVEPYDEDGYKSVIYMDYRGAKSVSKWAWRFTLTPEDVHSIINGTSVVERPVGPQDATEEEWNK